MIDINVIDLETTGLDQEKDHRIIEIAMVTAAWDGTSMRLKRKFVQRIDPERPIDKDAEAVHHISWNDLIGQPKWPDVAPTVVKLLGDCPLLVAHNMNFDGPFVTAELLRIGLAPPPVQTFCTMENARWATATGKQPRLEELCFSLGVDYDREKAHAALYDVLCTVKCLSRGLKRGFYCLPKEVTSE